MLSFLTHLSSYLTPHIFPLNHNPHKKTSSLVQLCMFLVLHSLTLLDSEHKFICYLLLP